MSAQALPRLTPPEYLQWERRQETRHEYVGGEIFAMTGASRAHNLICGNTFAALHGQLRRRACEVYSADMRVKVTETGLYTYPDIAALCEPPQFEDAEVDTLLNPSLIIEVLSDSTERYDRGANFAHYRNLASLSHYLLVSQSEYRVEHYVRQAGRHWLLTEYLDPEERIALTRIDCSLRLTDIYERVSFPAQSEPLPSQRPGID
ncbi:Uma2 family endonuclease [Thiorhodococcus minor]|uniref:Uma2 family endonuclease n=1 Tax=Thiorhodococcus minor TaxID=57489 RepID=A0A6M0JUL0_9GAMM|nr:Uma2 family endonuclease [Thiorhodococcus minor]